MSSASGPGSPSEAQRADTSAMGQVPRSWWRNPIRAIYDWVLSWADHPAGPWALGGLAFAESSFFPVPPDVLLIPMCLSVPRRSFWYAALCTTSSVIGGMLGYLIGYAAYESVGRQLLELQGLMDGFGRIGELYAAYEAWAVALAGFTPIPYKVFTIAAGLFQVDFTVFVVASIVGRGGRFFLVAALLRLFGEPMKEFIDRYFNLLTLLLAVLIVAGFVVLHYVSR